MNTAANLGGFTLGTRAAAQVNRREADRGDVPLQQPSRRLRHHVGLVVVPAVRERRDLLDERLGPCRVRSTYQSPACPSPARLAKCADLPLISMTLGTLTLSRRDIGGPLELSDRRSLHDSPSHTATLTVLPGSRSDPGWDPRARFLLFSSASAPQFAPEPGPAFSLTVSSWLSSSCSSGAGDAARGLRRRARGNSGRR